MERITLTMLEVTDGHLPEAVLSFSKGLNVISGVENRGKSYAFSCLDYLLGAVEKPEPNSHSTGYTKTTLYFTVGNDRRGVVRRNFDGGRSEVLPYHPVKQSVPATGWVELAKTHHAKRESLSRYWLSASGLSPTLLRGDIHGATKTLTVRFLAHLTVIDELRIMDKRSPALSSQATVWTADRDALAVMLGARTKAPNELITVLTPPQIPVEVRSFIEQEIDRLNVQIQAMSDDVSAVEDLSMDVASQAAHFTSSADAASRELQKILEQIEAEQQKLLEARSTTRSSREIVTRLILLQEYYKSDLRRLDAVSETSFLLAQMTPVPCPTCLQPLNGIATSGIDISSKHLETIQLGSKAEAEKIRSVERDLAEVLSLAQGEAKEARRDERIWSDAIETLRIAAQTQTQHVAEVHAQLNQAFVALDRSAQRQALKQQRDKLSAHLGDAAKLSEPEISKEDRTEFDSTAVREFCDVIRKLLVDWQWNYTPPPIEVTFDPYTTDIFVSGFPRRSFGKAVRALLSSAFLIGLMDYCFFKNLPHPGFVILDSPLTTKREGSASSADDEQLTDDILNAFFECLARNYRDRQVIIIDNKDPPPHLKSEINHIRFGDDSAATRKGFFPS